jgi:hypothetical protein
VIINKIFLPHSKKIVAFLVVIIITALGVYFLTGSHAASPFASITADGGTLSNGALKQTCSGSNDGYCVVFAGIASSEGGGSNMTVGLNAGGWGASGAKDVAGAVNHVRLDQAGSTTVSDIGYYTSDNVKADIDYSGDVNHGSSYDSGGVSAINASSWASGALSWYESSCNITECPTIEVLNEPYGSWFWGSNADDQTNADAYGDLVEATYNAFHTKYGSSGPKILANTFANGCSNGSAVGCSDPWWGWLKSHDPSIANYYDGVIIHAYGGTGNATLSAEGDRNAITSAYDATGKPVYVTEVGWPTDIGNNSSPSSVN